MRQRCEHDIAGYVATLVQYSLLSSIELAQHARVSARAAMSNRADQATRRDHESANTRWARSLLPKFTAMVSPASRASSWLSPLHNDTVVALDAPSQWNSFSSQARWIGARCTTHVETLHRLNDAVPHTV